MDTETRAIRIIKASAEVVVHARLAALLRGLRAALLPLSAGVCECVSRRERGENDNQPRGTGPLRGVKSVFRLGLPERREARALLRSGERGVTRALSAVTNGIDRARRVGGP